MKKTLLASALAFACSNVSAGQIMFNVNAPPPLTETTTEINEILALGKFDSGLGTLQSIALTLFASATSSATFTNAAANPQTFLSSGSVFVSFDDLGGILAPVPSINLALDYTGGPVSIAGGGTFASGEKKDEGSALYNIALADFGFFSAAGGGSFDLSCNSISGITIAGGGGNINADQETTAGCGAEVVYTFEDPVDVPEPATLALLGLGLLGLGGLRRRQG